MEDWTGVLHLNVEDRKGKPSQKMCIFRVH